MSHNLLEIMNVKQGDCLILRPRNCQFDQDTFLVDTGDGRCDFTPSLATDQNIHIMLTHAHADHINGFSLMLTEPNFSKIKSLILPYYHNESVLIAKALLNLKGMETLSDKWGLKMQLGQVVANQRLLINVAQKIRIIFVKDKDSLCNHIHILNPPCLNKDYLSKLDDSTLIEISNYSVRRLLRSYCFILECLKTIIIFPIHHLLVACFLLIRKIQKNLRN